MPKHYQMPTDEDLLIAIRRLGTIKKVAEEARIPRQRLSDHINNTPGLREKVNAARPLKSVKHTRPTKGGKPGPKTPKAHGTLPPVGEITEEEMLRHQLAEAKTALRKDRKSDVHDERITAAVEQAIEARESKYSPAPIPKSKRSKTKHEFALLWSDLHAGEVVSAEETNGMNAYNWDIMLSRHDALRESLFSYQDNRPYPVEHLNIWALGDMLSGSIHDELVATNEIPLAEATVQLGLDCAKWLESLLERFERISLHGIVGNHPRAHKKPWAKQGYDNADWTAYNIMRLSLRGEKRIEFDIPKASQHPVEIVDRRVLLWHGDGVRSTMPGVPWGGVMRRTASLAGQYAASGRIDHFACGHFHQANIVQGGRVLMNGSVKGIDEFVLKQFGGGTTPQQLLTTWHPRRGLTDASLLDCP